VRLTIFAATGRTGRHVLDQAVEAGHDVTAVARNPGNLPSQVRSIAADLLIPDSAKTRLGKHYSDVALTEDLLRSSGLDWTAVGLPLLTDKPPTGKFRTAYEQSVRRGYRIARADAATFMLRVLDQAETIGHSLAIAH
jgi:hypothetical protein